MKKILPFLICLYVSPAIAQHASIDWVHQIGGSGTNYSQNWQSNARLLSIDNDGDYVLSAFLIDTVDLLPGPGNHQYISSDIWEINLIKYSSSGNLVWHKQMDSKILARHFIDDDNNIYFHGIFQDTVDFDPGPDTFLVSTDIDHASVFILKLDSNGHFKWVKSLSSIDINNFLFNGNATVDRKGNSYLLSRFNDSITINTGSGNLVFRTDSPHINNNFLLKYNTLGEFVWARHFKGTTALVFPSILIDSEDNLVVAGTLRGVIDFDTDNGIYLYSPDSISPHVVAKYDAQGNLKFIKQNQTSLTLLQSDSENNVWIRSSAYDTIDVDPGPDTVYFSGNGEFLTKWNEKGEFLWAKNYSGTIAIDSLNNFYTLKTLNDNSSNTMDLFLHYNDQHGNKVWKQKLATTYPIRIYSIYTMLVNSDNIYINAKLHNNPTIYLNSGTRMFDSLGVFNSYTFKISNTSIGINEAPLLLNDYRIFPNPTTGNISISSKDRSSLNITIFDITGKAISKKVINTSEKTEMEIEGNPGIYFIEVLTEQGERHVFKIIKM